MIPPELLPLLRPLEEFEGIRRRAARLGDRLCDLSYANPYDGVAQATRDVLRRALDRERLLDLQYSPFGGQTPVRRAVADHLAAATGLPFRFDDVTLTPGAMAALQIALRAVGRPGDEVIIPAPCWLDYPLYAAHQGLTPVMVPLTEPGFDLDVDAIAGEITPRTCAVLLSQPSNPAGRTYPAAGQAALARVLEEAAGRLGRTVSLIADETHRDFVSDGGFFSPARACAATLITYSFGKYHFIQGQRLGYLAVSPRHPDHDALACEAPRWVRVMGFCGPTALMQSSLTGLLELRHDLDPIHRWRARMAAELQSDGYRVAPADATFFLYVGTPAGRDDFEFTRALAAEGVLVLPAPLFHHRGWFRLALTGAPRMLEGALTALRRQGPR